MTVINHKSISGITSITAPAGSDNLLTVHTNDTTERFRILKSGAIVTGVATASNFKTGTTNVHSVGVEAAAINVLGADTPIGTGATIYNSGAAVFTGIVTATNLNVESKVGIGSVIPSNTLDVVGGFQGLGIYRGDYTGSGGAGINLNFGGKKADGTIFNAALISGIRGDNTAQAGELRFSVLTGGTMSEKLRIQSTGAVGINTSVPSTAQDLTIDGASNYKAGIFYKQAGVNQYRFMCEGGTGHVYYDTFKDGGDHVFRTDAATTGGTERLRITSAGQLCLTSDANGVDTTPPLNGFNTHYETDQGQVTIGAYSNGGTTHMAFFTNESGNAMTQKMCLRGDGTLGIGIDSPTAGDLASGASFAAPKFHILGDNSQSGAYELLARFGSGTDADNTGSTIVLNHANDRGLAIQGGRSVGNRSYGALKSIDNVGRISDAIEIRGGNGQGVQHLAFYTGDSTTTTQRLHITSGGNVNIGGGSGDLTQTVYPLSVLGSTSGTGQINIVQRLKFSGNSNTYNTGTVIAFTNTTTNANAYSYIGARIDAGASGDNANALVFATNATNTAPTEKLRITSAGRVGINENNPEGLLHIDGGSNDPYIYLQRSGAGDAPLDLGGIFFKNDTKLGALIKCRTIDRQNAELIFETMDANSRTEKFRIKDDGRLMTQAAGFIFTSSSAGSLTLAGGNTNLGGKIVLTGGNGTGNIAFHAQQSTGTPAVRMTILGSNGRVGINETSPSRILSVNGSINIQSGERIESYSSGGNLIIQGGSTYPGGHIRMWGGSGDDVLTLNTSGAATSSIERLRIHSDGIPTIPLSPTAHGSINASALVNTSGRQPANNNQFQTNGTNNLSAGWYTIAACSSGRASGRIGIRDLASSRHQAVTFYAGHHYGGGTSQNCINTIFSSGRHSGNPLGALRIKAYGTYDGAMVQVYLRDGTNNCQAFLLGDNLQTNGWIMKNWVPDGTDPGTVSNHSNIHNNMSTPGSYSDLNELQHGGMSSGGHILPDADNRWTLGRASYRWHEIFCMNSSNTTSDETLKQDIAALTTAEMNAAKRLSALFKTYRWKDAVTEKGTDKARTHTGIIAQQVKSAMEAESLDPAKYSFYCIDEWYEDSNETKLPLETATRQGDSVGVGTNTTLGGNIVVPTGFNKVTRYSIRYVELLAFISAYNEQRFTSIESRLTALESS